MSKKKWSIVIVGIAVIALSAGLMNGLILNTSSTADLDDSEFEEPVIGDKEVISNGTHRLIYKRIKLSNTVYKRYQNGTVIMVITNTRDLGFPDLVGISNGTITDVSNVTLVVKLFSDMTDEGWIYKTYYIEGYMIPIPKTDVYITDGLYQLLDITEIADNYFDAKAYGWELETVVEN